jgi:plastocyanin
MLRRLVLCLALCYGLLASVSAATVTVHMFNFNFSTDATHATIISPTIHVGDTIHWVLDEGFHCTSACAGMSENWASGMMSTVGSSFDHTFTHAGTFNYYCCIHGFDNGNGTAGGMSGTVTVLPPSVTGTITLQNFSGAMPAVTIEVRNPGSTTALNTYNVTPASDGTFTFPAPSTGTYDIAFKASHWLRKVVANVAVTSNGASGLTPSLKNGDVNGDNVISLGDFTQLRTAFGSTSTDPNWNPNADLNGDGAVSLSDFTILRANFGQAGDP